jgi:hypothetical protein
MPVRHLLYPDDMLDPNLARLIVELVEKMGLVRRDMIQKKEIEKYEARLARVEQKLSQLADFVSADDPALAKQLRTAWQMPARSLAFRNADHQKDLKRAADDAENDTPERTSEDS